MREAAEQLKMPYTTYVNYEKGICEPNLETLMVLAKFYNTSIDYLIGSQRAISSATPNFSNIIPVPKMKKVPMLDTTVCKELLAAENIGD